MDLLQDGRGGLVAVGETILDELEALCGQLHACRVRQRLECRQEGVEVGVRAGAELRRGRVDQPGERVFARLGAGIAEGGAGGGAEIDAQA